MFGCRLNLPYYIRQPLLSAALHRKVARMCSTVFGSRFYLFHYVWNTPWSAPLNWEVTFSVSFYGKITLNCSITFIRNHFYLLHYIQISESIPLNWEITLICLIILGSHPNLFQYIWESPWSGPFYWEVTCICSGNRKINPICSIIFESPLDLLYYAWKSPWSAWVSSMWSRSNLPYYISKSLWFAHFY